MNNKNVRLMNFLFFSCVVFAGEYQKNEQIFVPGKEISFNTENISSKGTVVKVLPNENLFALYTTLEEKDNCDGCNKKFSIMNFQGEQQYERNNFLDLTNEKCFDSLYENEPVYVKSKDNKGFYVDYKRECLASNRVIAISKMGGLFIIAHSWGGMEASVVRRKDPDCLLINNTISSISFSPTEKQLAIGSYDGSIAIVNLGKKSDKPLSRSFKDYYSLQTIKEETVQVISDIRIADHCPIVALQYIPGDKLVFCSGKDVYVKDIEESGALKKVIKILFKLDSKIKSLAVSHGNDSIIIAAGSEGGELKIYDMVNETVIKKTFGGTCSVNSLNFSPDNKFFAVGLSDGKIKIFKAYDNNFYCVQTLNHKEKEVGSVEFGSDGKCLVVKTTDKSGDDQQGKDFIFTYLINEQESSAEKNNFVKVKESQRGDIEWLLEYVESLKRKVAFEKKIVKKDDVKGSHKIEHSFFRSIYNLICRYRFTSVFLASAVCICFMYKYMHLLRYA